MIWLLSPREAHLLGESPLHSKLSPKSRPMNKPGRDAGGIIAGSRWLSPATPPDPRPKAARTPAGVPALEPQKGRPASR